MSTAPQDLTGFDQPGFGEPVWALATMFPPQGAWSVEKYLDLTDSTNRLIEFTDGRIEVLEMPTVAHQMIAADLFFKFREFVAKRSLGEVLFMGLRVQVAETKFREPDIVFQRKDHSVAVQDRYWIGAELALEIVSDDAESRERDFVTKRADYADAGVSEYWIVDPMNKRITVLSLEAGAYVSLGEFAPGDQAPSRVLEGFHVDVSATFQAAER
jgi:Uma2 family endonuclease